MAEKLKIRFIKGTFETAYDVEWEYEVSKVQIFVNGEGPFFLLSNSKTFHINEDVVKRMKLMVKRKRYLNTRYRKAMQHWGR